MTDRSDFERGLGTVGDERLRPGEWIVYPEYEIIAAEGEKYIYAPMTAQQIKGRRRYRPLSHSNAGMFLEFAGWAKRFGMEKTADRTKNKEGPNSKKNEQAALAWAKKNGVLGVNDPNVTMMGYSSLGIRDYLGRPGPDGFVGQGMLNDGSGGRPKETVARFTDEALEAYVVLRLYEAATLENAPDVKTVIKIMGKERDDWLDYPSIREIHGKSPEAARAWALQYVEETVTRKVAGRCYPTLSGGLGSYEQGWGFDSLLGAMWLQMLWMMTGQTRRCLWCHNILIPEQADGVRRKKRKTRSDKEFCSDEHRAKWNYHHGSGKSSKYAREQARRRAKRSAD